MGILCQADHRDSGVVHTEPCNVLVQCVCKQVGARTRLVPCAPLGCWLLPGQGPGSTATSSPVEMIEPQPLPRGR